MSLGLRLALAALVGLAAWVIGFAVCYAMAVLAVLSSLPAWVGVIAGLAIIYGITHEVTRPRGPR